MGKIVGLDEEKRGAIRQCTVQMLSPGGKVITKLKRPPQQLVPLEVDSSLNKIDAEALVRLEGDPRSPVPGSRITNFQKYSKKQLATFKKDKIWPPYRPSETFLDPSSINTGPEKDFVNEVFKDRPNLQRDYSGKRVDFVSSIINKEIKHVKFALSPEVIPL